MRLLQGKLKIKKWTFPRQKFWDVVGAVHEQTEDLALIHIPDELWDRFKVLQRRWLRLSGAKLKRGGLVSTPLRFYDDDPSMYLNLGLFGALRYLFKGLDTSCCAEYGIRHEPQGWVSGKRFGYSESLSPSKAGAMTITLPGHPALWVGTAEA